MRRLGSCLGAPAFAALVFVGAAGPAAAQNLLDRARDAVQEAGRSVEEAARDAGRSVSDFLTEHPELNRDIVDFGQRIGIPGFEEAQPESGPVFALAPDSGPPGTEVTLAARGLPGSTDVVVSAGAEGAEYRPVGNGRSDDRGALTMTVAVPDWAAGESAIVFALATADGRVRLASAPFPITDDPGVTVTGTLSREGAECQALRGDDGTLYTLAGGDLGSFQPGDRVTVTGTLPETSTCMQGTTIAVRSVAAAK